MKKTLIVLLMLMCTASSSLSQTSDDIYVRKDVFDVHMMNINQNLEKILNELQAQRKDINELAKVTAVLSARIDGTNSRIDDLRNGLYLWLVVIGTFIAFVGVVLAWPKVKDFLTAQKTTLTIQDIERIVDAKLNARSQ